MAAETADRPHRPAGGRVIVSHRNKWEGGQLPPLPPILDHSLFDSLGKAHCETLAKWSRHKIAEQHPSTAYVSVWVILRSSECLVA